jgi:transposase InsO family protein
MSVAEQRYKAVMAVLGDGRTVTEVARDWGVSRQTLHSWLARYEVAGLEGLGNASHRPASCPHQMAAELEVLVLEMRRSKPYWGARRLALELAGKGVKPVPSESSIYRCLVRAGVVEHLVRRRRKETWKRWERGLPMELWQLDVVGGFNLADGHSAKALTGIDDHSRYCVAAKLMLRERTHAVCDGFEAALRTYGVPSQVLTDNGKVFTGRYAQPPVEVMFDRLCRENGVDHLLTQPRSPTTTGKIERFHRTMRVELDTRQVFRDLKTAQAALDEWVVYYNTQRPHQALGELTPGQRFHAAEAPPRREVRPRRPERQGEHWVSRKVASNGVVCVGYQQVCVGSRHAGLASDVLVGDKLLQFWVGEELVKTAERSTKGEIRKKHADGHAPPSA